MKKKFMVAEVSDGPVAGHDTYGYLLLARDAELWKVGRRTPDYLPREWTVGMIIEVRLRYIGPDEVKPDFQSVGCEQWEPMRANDPYRAVAKCWDTETADRFVSRDGDR